MNEKRTPGPWTWDRVEDNIWVLDQEGNYLAEMVMEDSEGLCRPMDAKANAAFIVRAANNHDELMKTLQEIADIAAGEVKIDDVFAIQEMAESAIAKAKGGK